MTNFCKALEKIGTQLQRLHTLSILEKRTLGCQVEDTIKGNSIVDCIVYNISTPENGVKFYHNKMEKNERCKRMLSAVNETVSFNAYLMLYFPCRKI